MSFTPSDSSNLQKEQKHGWHGSGTSVRRQEWNGWWAWREHTALGGEERREGIWGKPVPGLTAIRAYTTNSYL